MCKGEVVLCGIVDLVYSQKILMSFKTLSILGVSIIFLLVNSIFPLFNLHCLLFVF